MPRATLILTTTAALTVVLVGCSAPPTPAPEPAAVATEVALVTEAPVETAPPVPVAGDTLTVEQAETLPEGFAGYELADGTIVAVAADETLPAAVVADVSAKADAAWVPGRENGMKAKINARLVAAAASRETGKKVLVVAKTTAATDDSWEMQVLWTVTGALIRVDSDGFTRDEAVAAAEAYVAKQDNPANFEIIVQN